MSARSLVLTAAALLIGAGRLGAQSCLAQGVLPRQVSIAGSMDQESNAGLSFAWASANERAETLIDAWQLAPAVAGATSEVSGRIVVGSALESDQEWAARVARPGLKGVWCSFFDIGGTWTDNNSPTIYKLGFGYAFGNDLWSAHAAPEVGFGDKGVGFVLDAVGGAVFRWNRLFAGADLLVPLNRPGATPSTRLKAGFVFGKAVSPTPTAAPAAR